MRNGSAIWYSPRPVEFSAVTGDHAGRTDPYRGRDGVRQYFREVAEVWDELRDGLVTYVRVYPSAADAMAAFEGRGA